jgi:hypothetical protein
MDSAIWRGDAVNRHEFGTVFGTMHAQTWGDTGRTIRHEMDGRRRNIGGITRRMVLWGPARVA